MLFWAKALARPLLPPQAMKRGAVAVLVLAGCNWPRPVTVDDVARARAVDDLHCPAERVALYEAADGSRIAQGCGAWLQYECFEHVISVHRGHSHYEPVCVREASAGVNPPPAFQTLPAADPPLPPQPTAAKPASSGAGYPFD